MTRPLGETTEFLCQLCGKRFTRAESKTRCNACPAGRGCALVCCPNCGYQFPSGDSPVARRVRGLLERKKKNDNRSIG